MQRLRRIKQLGGTYMVFHTAEHSRFSHSLGVYEMARKIIRALMHRGTILSEDERLLVLSAALLHDLGHGPFHIHLNLFLVYAMSYLQNALLWKTRK